MNRALKRRVSSYSWATRYLLLDYEQFKKILNYLKTLDAHIKKFNNP